MLSNKKIKSMEQVSNVFYNWNDYIYLTIKSFVSQYGPRASHISCDDLFHDFFLDLVEKPIPTSIENIQGYLYRAIRNDVLNAVLKRKSYEALITRYTKHFICIPRKNGQEEISLAEEANKMFELIENKLSRREAESITLRYKKGYSIRQIAKEMNVNDRTVSRYISVGLSRIRRFLMKKQGDKNDSSQS